MTIVLMISLSYLVFTVESVLDSSLGVCKKILACRQNTTIEEELAQQTALLTTLVQESLKQLRDGGVPIY